MTQEKILEVNKISKKYGSFSALDSISFYLNSGEIMGLLGPNGAGKTTILNTVLGLVQFDSGNILVFGKDLSRQKSEILADVNFAAAYASLPGNLKVRENLNIYAMLYGLPDGKTRVKEIMKNFQLDNLADKKTGLLSTGEQARLSLAKTKLNNPRLIIMDEPTSSLDPDISKMMRDQMREYAKSNNAGILWASHDMHEIEEICDRIIFLYHGKILIQGDPKVLTSKFKKKNLEELFISLARGEIENNASTST